MAWVLVRSSVFSSFNPIVGLKPQFSPLISPLRWIVKRCRKPPHLPMAASKMFNITERPVVPRDEEDFENDLMAEYERKMKSLRQFCYDEYLKTSDTSIAATLAIQEEERNLRGLLEENEKENERIRHIREEALELQLQQKQMWLLEKEEKRKEERERKKLEVEEIVKKLSEECSQYVTYESLEKAIEYALDNPVTYDFCINLNGEIQWGNGTQGIHHQGFFKSVVENVDTV